MKKIKITKAKKSRSKIALLSFLFVSCVFLIIETIVVTVPTKNKSNTT